MGRIEELIVLAVALLYISIVSGSKGPDHFVPYAMLFQMDLEHGGFVPMSREAVGEFRTIVCLNALNRQRKCFDQMLQKHGMYMAEE